MKKKSVKNLIVVLFVALIWGIWLFQSYNIFDGTEQKIIDTIDEMIDSPEYSTKTICLFEEFEDGYICVAVSNNDQLIFTYLKEDKFTENGLSRKAKIIISPDEFINNIDPLRIFKLSLVNFSKNTIYFGCCKSEYADDILVNSKTIDSYQKHINIAGTEYSLNFWFTLSRKIPVVELK